MSRTGEYQKITIFFAGLAFLSMVGYTVLTDTTPLYFLMTCMLCEGFSLGVALTTTLIAMLSCVETKGKIPSYFGRKSSGDANIVKKDMATITSMSYLFRSAGGVIGISATSAIFQAVVKSILTEKITGPDAAKVRTYMSCARWIHRKN